jgi:hypothetical protein
VHTDDVFLKKLVKRAKQPEWFVSYSANLKSKKRTGNSYVASATEVVHQLMPTDRDIIESTVAAKGDAPSASACIPVRALIPAAGFNSQGCAGFYSVLPE